MRKILLLALAVSLSACTSATAPKSAPSKPSKLEICRSGWTITAGDRPDSTYTGCQG